MIRSPILLAEIDRFLGDTGMSETYFGKRSVGNSELVKRLRDGGRVWPETEAKVRSFILFHRSRDSDVSVSASEDIQESTAKKVNVRAAS